MKNIKFLYLRIIILSGIVFTSCEKEEVPAFEYKPIPKSAVGEKLVNGTDLIADIYIDTTYKITDGAVATELAYLSMTTGLAMKMFVFEVDLTNPNVSIEVSTPNNKPAFTVQPMTEQAGYEDSEGHKVWGGINGDFFTTSGASIGTPQGILYKDGVAIKTTFASSVNTYFAITKDKKALVAGQDVYNDIKATFREALGGRVWLVKNGLPYNETDAAVDPRTCIGVSEDGLTIYIMAVDGRNFWYSNGMNYSELGKCMKALGAYNAVNLDGGGSTTFFVRNTPGFTPNRFQIKNWPSDGGGKEREVANGLLIIGK